MKAIGFPPEICCHCHVCPMATRHVCPMATRHVTCDKRRTCDIVDLLEMYHLNVDVLYYYGQCLPYGIGVFTS